MDDKCRVCGGSGTEELTVREMMNGTGERFLYQRCGRCGCLQLKNIPENMEPYYFGGYYSFQNKKRGLGGWLYDLRSRYYVSRKIHRGGVDWQSCLGKALSKMYPAGYIETLCGCAPDFNAAVLDVGCGSGKLLFSLKRAGYHNLSGIDPYLKNTVCSGGVRLERKTIFEVEGDYDLIMFHHSFEHMERPREVLEQAGRLVRRRRGAVFIRIPAADSYVFDAYGENWVELDAPRHFYLYTREGIRILAKKTGLSVEEMQEEGGSFEFIGSELYRRGYPLAEQSLGVKLKELGNPLKFRRLAKRMNREGRGGRIACVLRCR